MTAPTRTPGSGVRSGQTERERTRQRTRERANPRVRERSAAAERAYARKQERGQRSAAPVTERRARKGGPDRVQTRPGRSRPATESKPARQLNRPIATAKRLQEKVTTSRGPFVIAAMGVLVAGIIGTLWLSIAAVSNSYELRNAAAEVNKLSERKETLLGQVSRMNSTPALQRRAEQLGLVPGPDPAHIVVNEDGSVRMVGEPEVAKAPKPPAPKPPVPQPGGPGAPQPGGAPPQGPPAQDTAGRPDQSTDAPQEGDHPAPPPAGDNDPVIRASGGR